MKTCSMTLDDIIFLYLTSEFFFSVLNQGSLQLHCLNNWTKLYHIYIFCMFYIKCNLNQINVESYVLGCWHFTNSDNPYKYNKND